MASISIASIAIPNWELGADVQLRIYPLQNFVAADNTIEVAGNPSEDSSQNCNFFAPVTCTLSGTTLTISSCTLESTTDSLDNQSASYGAYFFTLEGVKIAAFGVFSRFVLPATPTSTTWAALQLVQEGIL